MPHPKSTEWTREDSAIALAQGWEIFSTSHDEGVEDEIVEGKPYGHRPYELQAVDDDDTFDNDTEAHDFAREQYRRGDPVMVKAANFLRIHSPAEFVAIFGCYHQQLRQYTVIGYHFFTQDRFAKGVYAITPEDAEKTVLSHSDNDDGALVIVATLRGWQPQLVDNHVPKVTRWRPIEMRSEE